MKSYWQNTKTYYGVYNDDIVLNVFRSCYLNQWFCKFGYISVMMIMTNKTCEVFQPQCRSQCYGRQSPRPGRPDKSILVMVAPYGSWQLGPNCTRPDYLGQLGTGQLSPRGPTVHFLGAEDSSAPGPICLDPTLLRIVTWPRAFARSATVAGSGLSGGFGILQKDRCSKNSI